jgi:hypothetical protein
MNNKIKSKIFASYIGAKVELCQSRFSEDSEDRVFTLFGVTKDDWFMVEESKLVYHFNDSNNDSLLLTSLLNVSDEDAIKCAELGGFVNFSNVGFTNNGYWVGWNEINKNKFINYIDLTLPEIDFLRSKGYALPYMDYSVEDLVKEGVYKLK